MQMFHLLNTKHIRFASLLLIKMTIFYTKKNMTTLPAQVCRMNEQFNNVNELDQINQT